MSASKKLRRLRDPGSGEGQRIVCAILAATEQLIQTARYDQLSTNRIGRVCGREHRLAVPALSQQAGHPSRASAPVGTPGAPSCARAAYVVKPVLGHLGLSEPKRKSAPPGQWLAS